MNRGFESSRPWESASNRIDLSEYVFAGIDVGKAGLSLSIRKDGRVVRKGTYDNNLSGFAKIIELVKESGRKVRACCEATSVYHWGIAGALSITDGVEVMVANPRQVKDFARSQGVRSKDDPLDASVIAAFAEKTDEFNVWKRPRKAVVDLYYIGWRIDALVGKRIAEKNRMGTLEHSGVCPDLVLKSVENEIVRTDEEIRSLRKEALKVIKSDKKLRRWYELLISAVGVAEVSAVRDLSIIATFPENLTARQWACLAGLDVRNFHSGTITLPGRLSKAGNKRLRHALFYTAMVAIRKDDYCKEFARRLREKGKKPKQIIAAMMRKYMHAFWGMFNSDTEFDGGKLFPLIKFPAA